MSTGESQQQDAAPVEATAGLLDQITTMMPRAVEKPRRDELIRSLVEESLKGTVKFDKNPQAFVGRRCAGWQRVVSTSLHRLQRSHS